VTEKSLKALKGKKLSGPLATPIDTGILGPLARRDLTGEYIGQRLDEIQLRHAERHPAELHRQRMAKIPDLARHLGIKFEHLDLTKDGDRASFYGSVIETLAALLIPGFQEVRAGKWPREMVVEILFTIENQKNLGKIASDLDGCMMVIEQLEPEKARPKNKSELIRKAKTLRNRVSIQRAELKRFPRAPR
jgi:hypothetical protein